jgi:hypothetical protein
MGKMSGVAILLVILSAGIYNTSAEENCFFEPGKGALLISVSFGYGVVTKAELLVTDPEGRKTGIDVSRGEILKAIPCSGYGKESIGDLETGEIGVDENRVEIVSPIDGIYKLSIIGTDSGNYNLFVHSSYDIMEQPSVKELYGTTYPGKIDNYEITYSSAPGSQVKVTYTGSSEIPLFDGKGQRPADVNKFLQYFRPMEARTELPPGTISFNLMIVYGKTIIRETFKAILNGEDISGRFDPLPGKMEIVKIPLIKGSNTLVLSVKGLRGDGKIAEDTDRLVFIVQ